MTRVMTKLSLCRISLITHARDTLIYQEAAANEMTEKTVQLTKPKLDQEQK